MRNNAHAIKLTMLARVDSLKKRYGGQDVLRGVSLRVEEGEILALVGRSGSGKSTLLHILGGLDRRFDGEVEVLGRKLKTLDDRALSHFRNREVGFIFQSFNLLDHLSVEQNVVLPAFFGERVDHNLRDEAAAALDRVGIRETIDARPGELSGGQRQRVAIARALFSQPKLLLADEPTGNLDSESGDRIIDLFRKLNGEGLTLVIVTHEDRVSRAATRVERIEDGQIVA